MPADKRRLGGAALALAATVTAAAVAGVRGQPGSWVLTWSDEFDGPGLNTSAWNVANNMTHGDKEWQIYTADNVGVSNGSLILTTQVQNYWSGSKMYNFTSGWVDTQGKVAQLYGRFDVRAMLPSQDIPSIWPAHWMMPNSSICWPMGGEIDIMEQVTGYKENAVFGTYHWDESNACYVDQWDGYNGLYPNTTGGQPPIRFDQDFHVFSLTWNSTTLAWYVDGNLYVTRQSQQPWHLFVPSMPFYFILNTAISFWSGGQQPPIPWSSGPIYHTIDYVRFYQPA